MAGYEHAIFMILLLIYLLQDMSSKYQASLYWIAGGLWLVFQTPFVNIEIPWNPILALTLPWIFWRNAQGWLYIKKRPPLRDVGLWLLAALLLALILALASNLPWLRAIFFGIVAASMLWQVASREEIPIFPGNIGPLTLVFLLVESSLILDAPRHYVGSLFSGAGVGMALALLSIAIVKKVSPKYETLVSLGQVYLAYWAALTIGTSAIAAALISVVVFAKFYQPRLDIKRSITSSTQLDDRLAFFIPLALFMFLGWQADQPLTLTIWLEASLGLCIGLLVTLLGRRMKPPRFEHLTFAWRSALQLGLFLLGILTLWPRGPELGLAIIWTALGSAALMLVLSATLLSALHRLASSPDEMLKE